MTERQQDHSAIHLTKRGGGETTRPPRNNKRNRKEKHMAQEKKATGTKRSVSKARLLKELLATMVAHDFGSDQPIAALEQAIRDDIVTEAMNK
jgi:hypothetical protein